MIAGGGDGQCAGDRRQHFRQGPRLCQSRHRRRVGQLRRGLRARPRLPHHDRRGARTAISTNPAIRTGTFLVNWLVEQLFNVDAAKNREIFKTLEAEAAQSPIGANGLALVPYWSGCMTPYWDTDARGVIAGLTASHRRGDVYRALLEGIALEQAMMTRQDRRRSTAADRSFRRHRRRRRLRSLVPDPRRCVGPRRAALDDGRSLVAGRRHRRRQRVPAGIASIAEAAARHGGQAVTRPSRPTRRRTCALSRASRHLCRSLAVTLELERAPGRLRRKETNDKAMTRLERADRRRRRRRLGRPRNRQAGQGAVRDHPARRDARWRRGRPRWRRSKLGKRLAVVSDVNTVEAMGRRVAKASEGARHDRRDRHARQYSTATSRPSRWCRTRRAMPMRWSRSARARSVGHLQICDLQGRPALCDLRHRRLDERLCRLDRLGHARQRLQDLAAGACAARHLPRSQGLGRRRPPGSRPRASATACAARPRRSTGGPRTACSARSIRAVPYVLQTDDEAPMIEAAPGLAQA